MDDVEEGAEAVHVVELARQRRRQIEPEAVHVHFLEPVAKAVHDELECARVEHVERVARPREVHVVAAIGGQPVIGSVVDAAE